MSKKNFFNIIDFGSSKIRFSTFDINLNEKFSNSINVYINNDFENHFEAVNKIVKIAEKKISYHIEDVILTLDSEELFVVGISLTKNLDKSLKINKLYKSLILELNQIVALNYDKYYLSQIIMDKCIIDNKKVFYEIPTEKLISNNLKVDFKIICFPKILIKKIRDGFIKNNLNILNIFCTSYIKSQSYVEKLNQNKISFLDIGWRRSSFIFFENRKLKFIETIPIGGFHITKDISQIFKISEINAEELKKLFSKTDTEFSYENNDSENSITFHEIIKQNISVDLLKKVILYRVQEIIDLTFKKAKANSRKYNTVDSELLLIGEGSKIFNNNSFYLNDRFGFNSINFYTETDVQICKCGLKNQISNSEIPTIIVKKQGIFETFFNFFSK